MVLSEIRDQFRKDDLMDLMSIVHPYLWLTYSSCMSLIYKKYVSNLMKHLYRQVHINGLKILGILDKK